MQFNRKQESIDSSNDNDVVCRQCNRRIASPLFTKLIEHLIAHLHNKHADYQQTNLQFFINCVQCKCRLFGKAEIMIHILAVHCRRPIEIFTSTNTDAMIKAITMSQYFHCLLKDLFGFDNWQQVCNLIYSPHEPFGIKCRSTTIKTMLQPSTAVIESTTKATPIHFKSSITRRRILPYPLTSSTIRRQQIAIVHPIMPTAAVVTSRVGDNDSKSNLQSSTSTVTWSSNEQTKHSLIDGTRFQPKSTKLEHNADATISCSLQFTSNTSFDQSSSSRLSGEIMDDCKSNCLQLQTHLSPSSIIAQTQQQQSFVLENYEDEDLFANTSGILDENKQIGFVKLEANVIEQFKVTNRLQSSTSGSRQIFVDDVDESDVLSPSDSSTTQLMQHSSTVSCYYCPQQFTPTPQCKRELHRLVTHQLSHLVTFRLFHRIDESPLTLLRCPFYPCTFVTSTFTTDTVIASASQLFAAHLELAHAARLLNRQQAFVRELRARAQLVYAGRMALATARPVLRCTVCSASRRGDDNSIVIGANGAFLLNHCVEHISWRLRCVRKCVDERYDHARQVYACALCNYREITSTKTMLSHIFNHHLTQMDAVIDSSQADTDRLDTYFNHILEYLFDFCAAFVRSMIFPARAHLFRR